MDDDELVARVAAAHGAVRTSALCRSRAERRAIQRLSDAGRLVPHPQHVVSLPEADRRVVLARRLGGLICCDHGLAAARLPVRDKPGRRVHLLSPDDPARAVLGAGRVTIHQDHRVTVDPLGSPFAKGADLLLTHMRCAVEVDALIALDAALRTGAVSRSELLSHLPGKRNARLRAVVRRADPRARSLLETIARYDLEEAGVFPEVAAPSPAGELDLLLGGRLDVETDGHQYHSSWEDWTHDRFRDQRLLAAGITPVRLTSQQVLARQTPWIVEPVARRLGCWPTP